MWRSRCGMEVSLTIEVTGEKSTGTMMQAIARVTARLRSGSSTEANIQARNMLIGSAMNSSRSTGPRTAFIAPRRTSVASTKRTRARTSSAIRSAALELRKSPKPTLSVMKMPAAAPPIAMASGPMTCQRPSTRANSAQAATRAPASRRTVSMRGFRGRAAGSPKRIGACLQAVPGTASGPTKNVKGAARPTLPMGTDPHESPILTLCPVPPLGAAYCAEGA